MIKTAGPIITIETPPSDPDSGITQAASITDVVAIGGGGFAIVHRLNVDEFEGDSFSELYLSTFNADGSARSGRMTIGDADFAGSPLSGRLAETGGDSVLFYGLADGSFTLREFNGANGQLIDGPDAITDTTLSSSAFITESFGLSDLGSFYLYQDDVAGDTLLRGRFFDAANAPSGASFVVAAQAGSDALWSGADQLTNDAVAAAYTLVGPSDTGDIYVTLFDTGGDSLSDPITVNQKTAGPQYDSQIAALTGGGFVVAWVDGDQDGSDGVKARIFDNDGNATTREFAVDKPATGDQNDISLLALSGGRFAVIWYEEPGGGEIKAQLFDREGNRIGGETLLTEGSSPSFYDQSPKAVEIDNGVMLLSWVRDVEEEGILARRFNVGQAGTNGNDSLNSTELGRFLDGFGGNDKLSGGKSADELNGGAGRDILSGRQGNDFFIFLDASESGTGKDNRDLITDFGDGKDRIDLSGIDAMDGGGDDWFGFIKKADFNGEEGSLRYEISGKSTLVQADIDGDGTADFEIELSGRHILIAKDFLL